MKVIICLVIAAVTAFHFLYSLKQIAEHYNISDPVPVVGLIMFSSILWFFMLLSAYGAYFNWGGE